MRVLFISSLFFLSSVLLLAQYKITGKVLDEKDNQPLPGVNVLLNELKTGTATDVNGEFSFSDISNGIYTLRISYIGHKIENKQVTVPQTGDLIIYLKEGTVDLKEIVVTGNPLSLDPKELTQSTITINSLEMQIRSNSTVAGMLDFQPGVSVRSNGTAASRPVIRGFSNNRILVLENGLRMGDLSNSSDDHGVSGDAASAEKIEVLRGPAGLLYGSNALGGVINIITEAIPNFVPHKLDGLVSVGFSSINNELNGSMDFHYGIDRFAFHGNYFNRENSDYADGYGNTVLNSGQSSHGYQIGMSFIPSAGIGGLSYSSFNSTYGIPVNPVSNEEDEEGPIEIDMKKEEFRILFENSGVGSFINSLSLKSGYQDYQHDEIIKSTGEKGTSFGLKSYSGDLSFRHIPVAENIQGVFGFFALNQQYTVAGEEAFTPNAEYSSLAFYLLEQIKFDKMIFRLGGRYEYNSIKIPEAELSENFFPADKKHFYTFSGSAGMVYNFTDVFSAFLNIASAFRAPTIEEFSSFAVHEATGSFDIGDRNLSVENNYGVDLGFRLNKEDHIVEINGYYNIIKDFIFRAPVNYFYNPDNGGGLFNDSSGLPVFKYMQANSVLYGTELKAQHDFVNNFTTTVVFDYVRAYQQDSGENLPQIPPMRFSVEQRYTSDYFWAGIRLKFAAAQNNISEYEMPSKGYGLVDIYCGVKIITGELAHLINLRIDNLLDQPYKEHLSAIKDFAYMPGRNIKLNYKFLF